MLLITQKHIWMHNVSVQFTDNTIHRFIIDNNRQFLFCPPHFADFKNQRRKNKAKEAGLNRTQKLCFYAVHKREYKES
jgi:hypothetical protein